MKTFCAMHSEIEEVAARMYEDEIVKAALYDRLAPEAENLAALLEDVAGLPEAVRAAARRVSNVIARGDADDNGEVTAKRKAG